MRKSLVVPSLVATVSLLAAPARAVDCTTIPDNLVDSCGFEDPGEVAAWFPNGGTPSFAAGVGETGSAVRGVAADFTGTWLFGLKSPCFPVSPGLEYALGYWVRLESGAAPDCTAGWQQWSDPACTAASGGAIGSLDFVPGGNYIEVRDSHVPAAGTAALQLILDCRTTGGAFQVLADNGYVFWDRPLTQEIPTLGAAGLAALISALGAAAFFALRRRRPADSR